MFSNGGAEEVHVLAGQRHAISPPIQIEMRKAVLVHLNPAPGRVVESAEQVRQRALARARSADDGCHLPGRNGERQAVQHRR